MRERPILFSAPMVRAILAGRKTHTRRVVKPPKKWAEKFPLCDPSAMAADHSVWWWDGEFDRVGVAQDCPYGVPGDRLWVREAWRVEQRCDDIAPRDLVRDWPVHFDAGVWSDLRDAVVSIPGTTASSGRPRASMHMPRWASRILLEIVSVSVERLNDISEADAASEGVQEPSLVPTLGAFWSSRDGFAKLWELINGPNSWSANPWVWVIEFKRVQA